MYLESILKGYEANPIKSLIGSSDDTTLISTGSGKSIDVTTSMALSGESL